MAGDHVRNYWWATQSANYDIAIEQATLWSLPGAKKYQPDRECLKDMRVGDVVFHYQKPYIRAVSEVAEAWCPASRPVVGYQAREGDGDDGWLVQLDVIVTGLELDRRRVADMIVTGPGEGPLDKNGSVKRKYVSRLSVEEGLRLLGELGVRVEPHRSIRLLGLSEEFWDEVATDREAVAKLRVEQRHLRLHLLGGAATAPCSLCHRVLPKDLLIAGHIQPRHQLSDAQRMDFERIAMLVCALGCDALFEGGYVVVDENGVIQEGLHPPTSALRQAIGGLVGKRCLAHNEKTAGAFAVGRTAS